MAAVKSVLVTGCSEGGIGYALVEAFQKRGLRVFATARNPLKMQALSALSNVILLQLDPTSPESVKAAVENVRDTMVTLDYLVNNAGQGITMPTLDVDIGKAKELFDINLWGALRVMQAFAPLVIAAKGTIISNCSIVTSLNGPWISSYHFLVSSCFLSATSLSPANFACASRSHYSRHRRHISANNRHLCQASTLAQS